MIELIILCILLIVLYLGLGLVITNEVINRNYERKKVKWILFLLWPICLIIGLFIAVYRYFKEVMIDT